MESKTKRNINIIGKIGRIVTMILIVVMILASVGTAIATVFAATLPKEAINVTINGTAEIGTDGNLFKEFKEVLSLSQIEDKAELGLVGGADGTTSLIIAGDDDILDGATLSETEKGYKVDFNAKTISISLGRIIYGLIATLVYLICIVVTLFMLRALMKSIEKCDSPFTEDIIKNMRKFGFSLIPFVVLKGIVSSVWSGLFSTGFDIGINLDFAMILVILVVFMLSMIFSYGAELQRQSDETL